MTAPTAESDRAPVVLPAASVEAPAGLVAHARATWERAAFTLAEEQGRDVVRCALGVPIGMSDLVPTGDGDDVEASGSVWFLPPRLHIEDGILSAVTVRRPEAVPVLTSLVVGNHAWRLTWTPQGDGEPLACHAQPVALDELPDGVDNGDLVMHVLDEQGREVSQQVTLFGAAGAQLDDELADLEAYAFAYDRALDRPELDPAARALLEEWAASRAEALATAAPDAIFIR